MKPGLLDILTGRLDDGTVVDAATCGSGHLVAASVRDHIRRLLAARQGSLMHLPDYGVPSLPAVYTDIPYASAALASGVRSLILRYEPRVRDVAVAADSGCPERGFVVRLQITAVLSSGDPVALSLGLREDGAPNLIEEEASDGHEA